MVAASAPCRGPGNGSTTEMALAIPPASHQSELKRSVLPLLPRFILWVVGFDTLYFPKNTTGRFRGIPIRPRIFL